MKTNFFMFIIILIQYAISTEKIKITHPRDKSLLGAGHLDIKWTSISNVKNYQLYINDQLVKTTTETAYDYYTTKVQKFTVYVQAELTNGEKINSQKIEFFVTKKGLAVNDNMGKNLDPLSMNMGWYYTWSPTCPFAYKDNNYKYLEYVPMIWNTYKEDANLETVTKGNFMYLLGYNEPDLADQSNIPYDTAVANWPKFKGKSRYLGSPVPALSPTWDDTNWLNKFMAAVDKDSVDFIALHCYYDKFGGENAAVHFIDDVVNGTFKKFGKPIWITEFAVSGWIYNDVENRKQVEEYMKGCIKRLNELEYVERYAWFSFDTGDSNNGASAMWTESTGKLTDLGNIYINEGNPEGYDYRLNSKPEIDINSYVKDEAPYPDKIKISEKEYQNLVRRNGVTASASSSKDNSGPELTIDNKMDTRWESDWSDPQSITVDLKDIFYVKQIDVVWQYASAQDYSIEVSTDGTSFTQVANVYSLNVDEKRSESFTFGDMIECRFVRINCKKRATEWGYSIFEIAVYGSDEVEEPEDQDTQQTSSSSSSSSSSSESNNDNKDPVITNESEDNKETSNSFIPDDQVDSVEVDESLKSDADGGNENNPDDSSDKGKSKLSKGAIATIVVVVVVVVVAAAVGVSIFLIRRRQMNNANNSEPEIMNPDSV